MFCEVLPCPAGDTLLHIACFLPTARDLLRPQLANKEFGLKCPPAAGEGCLGRSAANPFCAQPAMQNQRIILLQVVLYVHALA